MPISLRWFRAAILPGAALVLAAIPRPALAWSDMGHEIIALIADHYLDADVREEVRSMLASDTDKLAAHDIASAATWADRYRDSDRYTTRVHYNHTRFWHFVELDLKQPDVLAACNGYAPLPAGTLASDGRPDDCTIDKISQFTAEIGAPGMAKEERLLALKFLLNLVGEVHQPLQVTDDHNEYGAKRGPESRRKVSGQAICSNFWDAKFVEHLGSNPEEVANDLISKIVDEQIQLWSQGNADRWARESFAVASGHAYGKLLGLEPDGGAFYRLEDKLCRRRDRYGPAANEPRRRPAGNAAQSRA